MLQPRRPRRHACLVVCCFTLHFLIPNSFGVRVVAAAPFQQAISTAQTPEEKLAVALIEARTDIERQALLDAQTQISKVDLRRAINKLGDRERFAGNYARAFEIFSIMQDAAARLGDETGIAVALSNKGAVHLSQGDYVQADDTLNKSLAIDERLDNKKERALTLNRIAIMYRQQGDYNAALRLYQKALTIEEELRNDVGIARLLTNISLVFSSQGDYELGLQYAERSLKMREMTTDKGNIAISLNNVGQAYQGLGDYAQALAYYERSNKLATEAGIKEGMAITLTNIGLIYELQGKLPAALETYRKALTLAEAIGDKQYISNTLNQTARVLNSQNQHADALAHAERAGTIARQINLMEAIAEARNIAGQAHAALNNSVQARRAFDESISAIEILRSNVGGGEQNQQRYFEGKISPYYRVINLLIKQNKSSEAFAYAERAKARVLLDVLQNGRAGINRTLTTTEREREQNLNRRLASLNMQAARERGKSSPDAPALLKIEAEIKEARLDYENFQTTLYLAHPELRAARGETPPINLARAAELLPDAETALLEYVVTRDATHLFVLTRRSDAGSPVELKTYTLPVAAKDLTERANRFRELIAARGAFQTPARELYDTLLRPAEVQLKRKRRLVIVPDAALWNVPFQVLRPTANRFLIEDAAVSYAPSLTALVEMRKSARRKTATLPDATLLAFGNPALSDDTAQTLQVAVRGETSAPLSPLIAAEREVAGLRELYGARASRVYIGRAASEARVKAEAGRFRILQFATHGVLDDASPMYSHLVLSQAKDETSEDGLLEAWEMMNLDLRAGMVVLSACETARGRIGAGEGVIGMTWALFVAGVPTTVVSNWKVSSESTAELMLDFHRNLKKAPVPQSPAEALRQAALKLMKSGGAYRHPFYWAAFAVVGDGD